MIAGIAITGTLAALALGLLVFLFVLYKKGRFNFAPTKSEDPDIQSYPGVAYPTGQETYAPSMVASQFTSFNSPYPAGSPPATGYQSSQFLPPIPQQDSNSIAASSSSNVSDHSLYRSSSQLRCRRASRLKERRSIDLARSGRTNYTQLTEIHSRRLPLCRLHLQRI